LCDCAVIKRLHHPSSFHGAISPKSTPEQHVQEQTPRIQLRQQHNGLNFCVNDWCEQRNAGRPARSKQVSTAAIGCGQVSRLPKVPTARVWKRQSPTTRHATISLWMARLIVLGVIWIISEPKEVCNAMLTFAYLLFKTP